MYDAQENYPRAIKWYRAALALDPFNYEVSAERGLSLGFSHHTVWSRGVGREWGQFP